MKDSVKYYATEYMNGKKGYDYAMINFVSDELGCAFLMFGRKAHILTYKLGTTRSVLYRNFFCFIITPPHQLHSIFMLRSELKRIGSATFAAVTAV